MKMTKAEIKKLSNGELITKYLIAAAVTKELDASTNGITGMVKWCEEELRKFTEKLAAYKEVETCQLKIYYSASDESAALLDEVLERDLEELVEDNFSEEALTVKVSNILTKEIGIAEALKLGDDNYNSDYLND